jgi:hypothetical protein
VMFISDTASTGNVWAYGNLTASIAPAAGATPAIPINSLVVTMV